MVVVIVVCVRRALSQLAACDDNLPMNATPSIYRGFCFPGEIISHAVFLYHRFSLSLRDVEDLLAHLGMVLSQLRDTPKSRPTFSVFQTWLANDHVSNALDRKVRYRSAVNR